MTSEKHMTGYPLGGRVPPTPTGKFAVTSENVLRIVGDLICHVSLEDDQLSIG
jgi:hypothetical protein